MRRTRAQRRLIGLRSSQLAVQTLSAICILVPGAAALKNPCYYSDGARSVIRWMYFLRGLFAMLSLAIKLTDVRNLFKLSACAARPGCWLVHLELVGVGTCCGVARMFLWLTRPAMLLCILNSSPVSLARPIPLLMPYRLYRTHHAHPHIDQ